MDQSHLSYMGSRIEWINPTSPTWVAGLNGSIPPILHGSVGFRNGTWNSGGSLVSFSGDIGFQFLSLFLYSADALVISGVTIHIYGHIWCDFISIVISGVTIHIYGHIWCVYSYL